MCKLKEKREAEKERKREKECVLCGKKYKGFQHECPYIYGLGDLHLGTTAGISPTYAWSDNAGTTSTW